MTNSHPKYRPSTLTKPSHSEDTVLATCDSCGAELTESVTTCNRCGDVTCEACRVHLPVFDVDVCKKCSEELTADAAEDSLLTADDDGFLDDETPLPPPSDPSNPDPDPDPAEGANASQTAAQDPAYLARQIRRYIVKLSSRILKTDLRCQVDRYIPLVSPSRKNGGEGAFPCTLLCHPAHVNRAQIGRFGNLICHYIGLAIASYYAICRGEECEHILDRIAYLRDIAVLGPDEFVVVGDDRSGYMLMTRDAAQMDKDQG